MCRTAIARSKVGSGSALSAAAWHGISEIIEDPEQDGFGIGIVYCNYGTVAVKTLLYSLPTAIRTPKGCGAGLSAHMDLVGSRANVLSATVH